MSIQLLSPDSEYNIMYNTILIKQYFGETLTKEEQDFYNKYMNYGLDEI